MAEPVDIKAELLAIRAANNGVLTAKVIVEAAEDPQHPLHAKFEWDDAVAGPRYRMQQARQLVRVVRETFVDQHGHPEEIRVFHSLPAPESPTGRAYLTLDEIKRDEILTKQLQRQMEIEWRALLRKYDHFGAFIKMVRRDMRNRPDDGGGNGDDGEGDGDDDDGDGDEPLAV